MQRTLKGQEEGVKKRGESLGAIANYYLFASTSTVVFLLLQARQHLVDITIRVIFLRKVVYFRL